MTESKHPAMMASTAPGHGPRHVKLSESLGGGAHSHSHFSVASTAADFNALPSAQEEEQVEGVYIPSHIAGKAWHIVHATSCHTL
jgi:hypothetical protein